MFERYSDGARRALFFSRYEASELGSTSIAPEHLLLGLLHDEAVFSSLTPEPLPLPRVRSELERQVGVRAKFSTLVEIPFSTATKQALQFAAVEADALKHAHIGIEHLLLGLLRDETSGAAAVLAAHGVRLSDVRATVEKLPAPVATPARSRAQSQVDAVKELVRQLAQQTADNREAAPLIARIDEALERLRSHLGG
jgi:ATP-dependent Clp protease ATP-binding subunit ClpC